MVFGAAIGGLAAGAGSAVDGIAKIITAEVAEINLDLTPKKTKKIKADSKISAKIKLSPLTIFLGIDLWRYAITGRWDFSLMEVLFGGLPGTITEGFEDLTEKRADIERFTDSSIPIITWMGYPVEFRELIVKTWGQLTVAIKDLEENKTRHAAEGDTATVAGIQKDINRLNAMLKKLRSDPEKFFKEKEYL